MNSQLDHGYSVTKKIDEMKDKAIKYQIHHVEKLNSTLHYINKLENIKMGLTIDRIRSRVKDEKISNVIGTMNSLFIMDSTKIIYDKYINCLKEYYNTLFKHMTSINNDFEKLEKNFNVIQSNNGASKDYYNEFQFTANSLQAKLNKQIKFYSYDPNLLLDDTNNKFKLIRDAVDSHIERLFNSIAE